MSRSTTVSARRVAAIVCGFVLALSMFVLSACSSSSTKKGEDVMQEVLVVYAQDGDFLFADTASETVFVPVLSDATILNASGEKITDADLAVGDIVTVTGNGAMTMSYPAQYPGITKVQVVSSNNTDQVATYETVVIALFPAVDPTAIPTGSLNYTTSLGSISLALLPYSYQGFADDNASVSAQSLNDSFVNNSGVISEDIADVHASSSLLASVQMDRNFQSATVSRVALDASSTSNICVDLTAVQETVPFTIVENGELALTIEPGYAYTLNITFANGEAQYAFVVVNA